MNPCLNLFNSFPREYSPLRIPVKSLRQLRYLVDTDNGARPVYVSVYDKYLHADKVVLDWDCLKPPRPLVDKLESERIPWSLIFSGKKGYHIYAHFSGSRSNPEALISSLSKLYHWLRHECLDPHLFTPRALIRVPNTYNNSRLAVPLPREAIDWPVDEVINYSFTPRPCPRLRKGPDLLSFTSTLPEPPKPEPKLHDLDLPPDLSFVRELVRPCVFDSLIGGEPPHILRVDFVAELMWAGASPASVIKVIRMLGWEDFDEETTRYQVHQIYERGYRPLSCSRLNQVVPCPDCRYWFTWSG